VTNTNIEVKSKGNEPSTSLLRRFSRRVQNSGIIHKVKKVRYQNRKISDFKKKTKALHKIKKRKEIDRAVKLGKISPRKKY